MVTLNTACTRSISGIDTLKLLYSEYFWVQYSGTRVVLVVFVDLVLLLLEVLGVLGHFVLRIRQYSEYFRASYSGVRVIPGVFQGFR